MRRIIVLEFITLDGVIQGPGGPDEDTANGFTHGGWVAPYDDDSAGALMQRLLQPADLLLGRKTFDIWENYWPQHAEMWPGINEVTKYVYSGTVTNSAWQNCVFLKSLEQLKALKNGDGGALKTWGSSKLVQLLLQHDMVDEFWLMIHPVILGEGKKLVNGNALPAAFALAENFVTTTGVIFANYKRAGEVKTARIGG